MLMKLTPVLNFTDILEATFARLDPESAKNTDKLPVFFTFLGSDQVKAAHKMLMKLTPVLNFTDILLAAFARLDPESTKKYRQVVSLFCAFGICASKSCL